MTGVPAAEIAFAVPPLLTHSPAESMQPFGELDDAGFVVDGEQSGGHVPTVRDAWVFPDRRLYKVYGARWAEFVPTWRQMWI